MTPVVVVACYLLLVACCGFSTVSTRCMTWKTNLPSSRRFAGGRDELPVAFEARKYRSDFFSSIFKRNCFFGYKVYRNWGDEWRWDSYGSGMGILWGPRGPMDLGATELRRWSVAILYLLIACDLPWEEAKEWWVSMFWIESSSNLKSGQKMLVLTITGKRDETSLKWSKYIRMYVGMFMNCRHL